MSASRTPYLPTIDIPLLRAGEFFPFAAHPILIGAYQLWFTCDADANADHESVTVCIDLGKPLEINVDEALHVILGLCLGLPASSRASSTARLRLSSALVSCSTAKWRFSR